MTIADQAEANFQHHIANNSYPGRGSVVGRSALDDGWLMIYWIMGRSENSRNRRFVVDGPTLRTEPADRSKLEDPSLIIYEAMLELPLTGIYLVSNGDQTRTLYETLQSRGSFDQAMTRREREPDAPHYTPRISGMLQLGASPAPITLSILRANAADPMQTDRTTFRPAPPPPGLGYCLTTYQCDGSPLPAFAGDPLLVPCGGSAEDVLKTYWDGLDRDNRISLAVKYVAAPGQSGRVVVINRHGAKPGSKVTYSPAAKVR